LDQILLPILPRGLAEHRLDNESLILGRINVVCFIR